MAKLTASEKKANIVKKGLKSLDLKLLDIELDGINLKKDVTTNSVRKLAENDEVVEFFKRYNKEPYNKIIDLTGFPKAPKKFSSFQYKKEVEKYFSQYIDFHNKTLSGKIYFLVAAYCLFKAKKKTDN